MTMSATNCSLLSVAHLWLWSGGHHHWMSPDPRMRLYVPVIVLHLAERVTESEPVLAFKNCPPGATEQIISMAIDFSSRA